MSYHGSGRRLARFSDRTESLTRKLFANSTFLGALRRDETSTRGYDPATPTAKDGHGAESMARTHSVYYRDPDGRQPVAEFTSALPAKRAAKLDAHIEQYLNGRDPLSPPPEHPATSQVEGEMRELRVRFANTRYRVLYQRSGNLNVLLHAVEKDTGALQKSDIALAKGRMGDFKARMDAAPRLSPRAAGRDAPSSRREIGLER
jgi:phage-related protein